MDSGLPAVMGALDPAVISIFGFSVGSYSSYVCSIDVISLYGV
jgi:hypothetical protein